MKKTTSRSPLVIQVFFILAVKIDSNLFETHMQSGLEALCPKHLRRWQRDRRKAQFNYSCAYCGRVPKHLTIDHFVPRSLGGADNLANIIPACADCNRRKGSCDAIAWFQKQPTYTEARLEAILRALSLEEAS